MRERLKKAVEEKQEYLEGWQRARADFVNYKKDESARAAHGAETATAGLVESLLPALDTAELGAQGGSGEVLMVQKQLIGSLKKLGVRSYGKVGEPFDPQKHEAIKQIDTEDPEKDHTIESVARSGYSIGEKIIRPAQVTIYHYE